jgi:choice-of-anchor A domain-containing protein
LGLEDLEGRASPSSLAADFAYLGQYNVLGLAGSKIDITNPQTVVMGNVGLDAHAKENFSDGQIDGHLIIDATADISHTNNVKTNGPAQTIDATPVDAAAIDASNQIAAMTPTQTIAGIRNSMTIASTGHINVIKVNSVQLDGSSALTLRGGANDYFFINVSGKFAMTGTSSIQLDGVQQSHVIFNVVGTGEQVAFTGKSFAQGSFLAVNRDISVSGATVFGQLIGGEGHQIAITSAAHVCGVPFQPPCGCTWS